MLVWADSSWLPREARAAFGAVRCVGDALWYHSEVMPANSAGFAEFAGACAALVWALDSETAGGDVTLSIDNAEALRALQAILPFSGDVAYGRVIPRRLPPPASDILSPHHHWWRGPRHATSRGPAGRRFALSPKATALAEPPDAASTSC